MLLHILFGLLSSTAKNELGPTFGNGLAGLMICEGQGSGPVDTVILNHTLSPASSHGVLNHFWVTGDHGPGMIDEVWVSYFIDGESNASIEFQPAAMCGQFFPELMNETLLYSAGSLCGRNSNVGGWWHTFPIPFSRSVVVTARPSSTWVAKNGCLHSYINVRGTENLPIALPLSGMPLPKTARLQLQRSDGFTTHDPLAYVDILNVSAGKRGMVFLVGFGVQAQPLGGTAIGDGYIEGCWQFYRTANESFPGLVVGTGVEDYFDSAFYFGADTSLQQGLPFANPLAGMPFFARDGVTERISAYRSHTSDPLVFTDGGRLVWRVGEGHQPTKPQNFRGAMKPMVFTKCGNQYPTPSPSPSQGFKDAPTRQISAVNLSTYAWVYIW